MANSESAALIGRRAEEANEIIDVDYIVEGFTSHQAGWSREVRVRKWLALAGKHRVGNVGETDRDMLIKMQQYIAVTPHANRYVVLVILSPLLLSGMGISLARC